MESPLISMQLPLPFDEDEEAARLQQEVEVLTGSRCSM